MVVLSPAFLKSSYPQGELNSVLHEQLTKGGVKVIPLLVGPEEQMEQFFSVFPLIRGLRYVVWDPNPKTVAAKLLRLRDERPDSKTIARICLISSEYPPHVLGGLGVHVEQLTKALGAHPNLNVDVVLPTPQRYEYMSLITQVHLYPLANAEAGFGPGPRGLYKKPTSWLRFADVATQRIILLSSSDTRPDVIHCHDWVTVLAGIKCRWALQIPLVFHLHLPNRSRLCASIENLGLVCADLITVNSVAMYGELKDRRFGRPGERRLRLLREMFRSDRA